MKFWGDSFYIIIFLTLKSCSLHCGQRNGGNLILRHDLINVRSDDDRKKNMSERQTWILKREF